MTDQHCLTFTSAPEKEKSHRPPIRAPTGWITSPRLHIHGAKSDNTDPAQEIQEGANPSKIAGILRKMSAPNLEESKGGGSKARDPSPKGLACPKYQATWVESSEQADKSQEAKPATGDRTIEASAKQPTLGHVLSTHLSQPESDQGRYDILVHGPRSQGPRTLLIIHQDLQGSA